jgi:hypothetical protein
VGDERALFRWGNPYRSFHDIVSRLAATGYGLVELRHPRTVFLVGLVFDSFADSAVLVVVVQPTEAVTNETKPWVVLARLHPDDHHPRKEIIFDCEGNHCRVKMTE